MLGLCFHTGNNWLELSGHSSEMGHTPFILPLSLPLPVVSPLPRLASRQVSSHLDGYFPYGTIKNIYSSVPT